MKIKYLAIAMLSTTLLCFPLSAHINDDEPVLKTKKSDKASPKHSSAIPPSITALEVTAPNQIDGLSNASDKVETKSSKAYLKIDDIKGESSRATEEVRPTRIEFKSAIAAPDVDNGSGNGGKAVEATDYNSSRSNKSEDSGISVPDGGDNTGDDETNTKATDYNSSRSNKNTSGAIHIDNDDGDDETESKSSSLSKKGYDHYASSSANTAAGVASSNTSETSKEIECDAETEKEVCDEALDPDTCVLTTSVCHF